ncbi:hypothetical protein ACRAWF_21165 [Streptomyces sp. L7]
MASLAGSGSLGLLPRSRRLVQIPEVAQEGQWVGPPHVRASDPVYLTVAGVAALALLASVARSRRLPPTRRGAACSVLGSPTEWPTAARRHGVGPVLDSGDTGGLRASAAAAGANQWCRAACCAAWATASARALLAHEQAAHLRGRHHLFQTLWRLRPPP